MRLPAGPPHPLLHVADGRIGRPRALPAKAVSAHDVPPGPVGVRMRRLRPARDPKTGKPMGFCPHSVRRCDPPTGAVNLSPASRRGAFTRVAFSALLSLPVALAPVGSTCAQAAGPSAAALTLDAVVRAALARNPLLTAAEARVLAVRGSRITAGSMPNPVASYQVENAAFPGGRTPEGLVRENSTTATLPLDQLWQRRSRVRGADADVRAAEADLMSLRRTVVVDATRAFHRAALAQVGARGAADVEAGLDSLLRFNRTRVAEGATAEGDLIRLEVERMRVGTERALQEAELARARAALAPYLAAGSAVVPVVNELNAGMGSPTGAATIPPFDALAAGALTVRPDLKAARARAQSAAQGAELQRSLIVRQLGATFGMKTTGGTRSMIAGVSVPIPLFDQNRGEVQRARGEQSAAEQELAWAERRAAADVRGAYDAARVLSDQRRRLDAGFLSKAEESRRIAVIAYQEGAAPLLTVIDATRTLADARLTYYRALFAEHEALLDLYAAAGLDPLAALAPAPASTGTPSSAPSSSLPGIRP
jgi:cobalt-zinc-cadmium efflux system outer membrane protein